MYTVSSLKYMGPFMRPVPDAFIFRGLTIGTCTYYCSQFLILEATENELLPLPRFSLGQ